MSSNDHHERSSSAAKRSRRNLSPVWEHIEKNFELNKCICRVDGCNRTWGYDHSTGKLAIHLLNDHSIKINSMTMTTPMIKEIVMLIPILLLPKTI